MANGQIRDDMWWLFLFFLSRVSHFVFFFASIGMSVWIASGVFLSTGNRFYGVMATIWSLLVSKTALGLLDFYWNAVLEEDVKHTSIGK